MAPAPAAPDLVGRDAVLGAVRASLGRAAAGAAAAVLVSGEAGMGKTSLVRAAVGPAIDDGAMLGWGTCIDTAGAPGYWPWTQAFAGLVRAVGVARARRLVGDDVGLLGTIVPALGDASHGETSSRDQLLLMDAAARFLAGVAADRPVIVVIDDLHWSDESSLSMLDVLANASLAGVALVATYRHDEVPPGSRQRLSSITGRSEHLHLEGLGAEAVHELIERITGERLDQATSAAIHRRTGGHPFFVREVALLARDRSVSDALLPAAVREALDRRVGLLPATTRAALEVAAVAGTQLRPDVVASVLDLSSVDVDVAAQPAVAAGVLVNVGSEVVFGHDLLREVILASVELPRRITLHRAIGSALVERRSRSGDVAPAEIASHFVEAVPVDGATRAVEWSLRAAAADSAALAFKDAAKQLRRLRAAVADAAVDIDDGLLVDVLLAESDALARAGDTVDARGLLRLARDVADRMEDASRIARVALATAQLGAQFSVRRDETVRELERALSLVAGTDTVWEARLSATLAREWQHSVADDRPRAGPLSERALALGRGAGDPATLIACLLARHDLLWTPGAEGERAEVAREIAAVALDAGDEERHAEGLLLLANALLEQGSSAFEAALDSCLSILDRLSQPRHRYTAQTRRACLALLRGRLDEAAALIESSVALGERIREPDTGNVAMSQRLELVRARNQPDELLAFAGEAVAHWSGAPVHAHAVAAGFSARAGDHDAARRHVAMVVDLGTWRSDRSYLWSVFVRELARAAVFLGDRDLCELLLDDLLPLAGSCGVNGAVVAFAGSHAHSAALLAGRLGRAEESRALLEQAAVAYRRLGADAWLVELEHEVGGTERSGPMSVDASIRREGPIWHIRFAGRETTVPHTKGLADIARLLASPAREVHVLDLVDAGDRSAAQGEMVDRKALGAYRQRLADIDADTDEADRHNDVERRARLDVEREALLAELSRTRTVRGEPRSFANHPAERARKAVTARVRDAIRKLEPALPELSAHLESTIVTGTYCRYRTDDAIEWVVDLAG